MATLTSLLQPFPGIQQSLKNVFILEEELIWDIYYKTFCCTMQ